MKSYLDDLLVWSIILVLVVPIILVFARRKRIFIIILGVLIALGALPVAFMAEVSISGCCGAPSNGREGLGYVLGTLMAVAGISIITLSKKLTK